MVDKTPASGNWIGADKISSHKINFIKKPSRGQGLPFSKVNAAALAVLPFLLRRWLPDGMLRGVEYIAKNPCRADNRVGSFKVNIRTGRWADFATGDNGGDVISLAAYLFNLRQGEAKRRIAEMLGVTYEPL